jgi:arginase family enzyme
MWAWTTGDACGPNMMTRNSYALNMGYVMERAPVKPQRAILEANMGGDKKVSHRYFERGGHGKTVLVEATLTDEAVRRVLRTTPDDLLDPAFAPGTGTPEPGGLTSAELLLACRETARRLELVGADVVEVIPTAVGSTDITALVADRLVREILTGIALRRAL